MEASEIIAENVAAGEEGSLPEAKIDEGNEPSSVEEKRQSEQPTDVVREEEIERTEALEIKSEKGEDGLATLQEEDETEPELEIDQNAEIPENNAIPEEEYGPPVEISEQLSRGGSPEVGQESSEILTKEDGPKVTSSPPPFTESNSRETAGPRTTESEKSEYKDSGPSTPEFSLYDRAQLLEKYREALEERAQLQNTNNQLQHKLAEYFRKKKTDDRAHELEKSVTDQEQRYLKYMSNLEELQNEETRLRDTIKAQIEDLKVKCSEKQDRVQLASDEFSTFKYDAAKNAVSNRTGKPLPQKDFDQIKNQEVKKEAEVIQVRLENIKLKNRLKKRELQLKAKEELAEGLHLIDFEQLKIENQTYNEKIEERNEELLKLRKKITTTVQVLTHVKEKLQFVQAENTEQRRELQNIESLVAQKRDILTKTKQVRDALRNDNVKLKQKSGLLGNEPLLRDFEDRKNEGDDLRKKLEELKEQHVELSMKLNGIKKKVQQSKV